MLPTVANSFQDGLGTDKLGDKRAYHGHRSYKLTNKLAKPAEPRAPRRREATGRCWPRIGGIACDAL